MGTDEPRSIAVLQTAFLGDVVLTTPLFRALKRCWPASRLIAVVTPEAAPLIEEDPHLDRILRYDKRGRQALLSMVARLRAERVEAIVAPHRSTRTALLSLASGVSLRVGFRGTWVPGAYSLRIPRPPGDHEVDRNLSLLRGFGRAPQEGDRVLHCGYTEAERSEVQKVLKTAGVHSSERLVGLAPGSVWATKRWSPAGFAGVGQRLLRAGYRPVLLGAPGDRRLCEELAASLNRRAVVAAGSTSLKALAAWLDRVELLVTNDSAPVHVASARGTPTVAIFGATTPSLGFAPFQSRSRVVGLELECRPCGRHGADRCPRGHFRCMGDLRVDAVIGACEELLREGETA